MRQPEELPTAEELKATVDSGETVPAYRRIRFSRKADNADKKRLAQLIEQEQDPERKARLLSMLWHEAYPGDHATLVAYAASKCASLAAAAKEALVYCRSEEAYQYAKTALKNSMTDAATCVDTEALQTLLMNFRPAVQRLLLDALDRLEIDADGASGWHDVVLRIVNAGDRGVRLPRPFFVYVYERSRCSCCREYAVRYMGKRRWLTEDMKAECRFDSNTDIVAYVRRLDKRP